MSFRRTLAVALLCALPSSYAFAAEEAAAPTVKWMLPWKPGATLEYASEDLTTSDLAERERTRATSTATVRITEALKEGFVQAWSWRDEAYVVEEGDKAKEAQMREFAAAMGNVTLEVELDAAATMRVRATSRISPRACARRRGRWCSPASNRAWPRCPMPPSARRPARPRWRRSKASWTACSRPRCWRPC